MAANAYLVTAGDGLIVSLHLLEATATTAAAADADYTASAVVSVPDWVQPGHYYIGGQFLNDKPLDDLERLKAAARACHDQLLVWAHLLTQASLTHPATEAAYGHDILWRGHQGVYLNCNKDTLTVAQKIAFCEQTAIGALDVTNPEEFFEHVHEIIGTALTGPVAWVNPTTGARLAFSVIPAQTGLQFPGNPTVEPSTLGGGDWIDKLTL